MEGAIIGQYQIVRRIGAGGMGTVYLAQHMLVGRRAAIKILLPEFSVRREVVARFFNEARAMTAITDPGIVQMYDFGFHSSGSAYIVMELLEGETLSHRRKRLGRLPVIEALRLTRQVAGSLASTHAAGIIHRDLKPDNIFIVRDPEALGGERAKVLDFGIAKLSGDIDHHQTLAGAMLGTPSYMSPEQCRGTGFIDARSDIYSLGCVFSYLLTGRPPFARAGVGELISAHINDTPKPPSARVANIPTEVDEIVLRCLAKSPDARFQTMLELQAACDSLLARLSSHDGVIPTYTPELMLSPGFRSAIPDDMPANPTTLSSAAGVSRPNGLLRARRRRHWLWLGVGTAVVAVTVGLTIAFSGARVVEPSLEPQRATAPAILDASVEVDAAIAAEPTVTAPAATVATTPPPSTAPPIKPKPKRPPRKRPSSPNELYDDR